MQTEYNDFTVALYAAPVSPPHWWTRHDVQVEPYIPPTVPPVIVAGNGGDDFKPCMRTVLLCIRAAAEAGANSEILNAIAGVVTK